MKKFALLLLVSFLTLFSAFSHAEASKTRTEKKALVDWVIDNAYGNLTLSKAKKFVSSAITYANKHSLDPLIVLSIMKNESGFRETARSGYGAKGLMQVVPRWHQDKLKGRNPYDTDVSIEVGTQVLRDCWDKSNNNPYRTLSCYSGGGGNKYYKKVATSRKEIVRSIVEQQFINEEHIDVTYAMRVEYDDAQSL